MSDNKNMQLNDEDLDSVAGGIRDVNASGSDVGGDQTIVDQSKTKITGSKVTYGDNDESKTGDITNGDKVGGDKTGGNKTDVDTKIDTTVNYTKKGGLF